MKKSGKVIVELRREQAIRGGQARADAVRRRRRPITAGYSSPNVGSEYSLEQIEFLRALARYKEVNRRPHPTWAEVLAIARSLGYRKVADPQPLPAFRAEAG